MEYPQANAASHPGRNQAKPQPVIHLDAGFASADDLAPLHFTRSQERRSQAERIEDGAPQEGVAIFRKVDKAVLVAVQYGRTSSSEVERSLDELSLLLDTAGGETVGYVTQRRQSYDKATFIGSGKVTELKNILLATDADAVIFDDSLSPAQQRNLEEALKVKVLDRTILIMDIFAQHASSTAGAAQVELAQLIYLLPRLRGWGTALSKQQGGIGLRGPGETQLEVDRRKINRRIKKLRQDLVDHDNSRKIQSKRRRNAAIPTVALVGYTNAGKSTVMRALTQADVYIADQLFATLDTTARKLGLPDGRQAILTDTVGFVNKLPTQLVESFKSTLDDTIESDLLLHVVDASSDQAMQHIATVEQILTEINADKQPRLLVLNKEDLCDPDDLVQLRHDLMKANHTVMVVSAVTRSGIHELVDAINSKLTVERKVVHALIPWSHSQLVALAYKGGEVLEREDLPEGTRLVANLPRNVGAKLLPFADADPWLSEDLARQARKDQAIIDNLYNPKVSDL